MEYTNFLTYPLQILGIDECYNEELTAIESYVISEMKYTGDVLDLVPILPYFVYYYFCEKNESEVFATVGETAKVKEFTLPSLQKQRQSWNAGVKMLIDLCTEKSETVNKIYQSFINIEIGFII